MGQTGHSKFLRINSTQPMRPNLYKSIEYHANYSN